MIPINKLTIAAGLFFLLVGVYGLVLLSSPRRFAEDSPRKEDQR